MTLEQLLKGRLNSLAVKRAIRIIEADSSSFLTLLPLLDDGHQGLQDNAAWVFGYTGHKFPEVMHLNVEYFKSLLNRPKCRDGLKRNFFRTAQFIRWNSSQAGSIVELAFKNSFDRNAATAIRAFALTTLVNVIHDFPELAQEVKLKIEEELPYAKGGYLNRANKELKRLEKLI